MSLSDKQKECTFCTPEYNSEEVRRLKMNSYEVRKKYPRFNGTCLSCGYYGIKYASKEQYITGDY